MPKPYPREFRDDVVAVARRRENGVTLAQIAKVFGISESCLVNWLSAVDREAGVRPGSADAERAELREPGHVLMLQDSRRVSHFEKSGHDPALSLSKARTPTRTHASPP